MPAMAKSTMLCTPSSAYFARSFFSSSCGASPSPFTISAIASTSFAIGARLCLPSAKRYERPTIPPSVSRSSSSSGATLTVAMLVTSGRFMGAATARTRMSRILRLLICPYFPLKTGLRLSMNARRPSW
jgi:hypothetical protein